MSVCHMPEKQLLTQLAAGLFLQQILKAVSQCTDWQKMLINSEATENRFLDVGVAPTISGPSPIHAFCGL